MESPIAQPTDYHQMVLDTIAHALTSDPNPEVRAKAAESLGKLGSRNPIAVSSPGRLKPGRTMQRHPGIRIS